MRTRTHEIKIRLNDEEFAHLNEMVGKSNYSREMFLRFLLNGYVMQESHQLRLLWKKPKGDGLRRADNVCAKYA